MCEEGRNSPDFGCPEEMVMDDALAGLLRQLQEIEDEIERRFEERTTALSYKVTGRKVEFERAVLEQHRRIKQGVIEFLRTSRWPTLITSPFIYGMIVPIVFLDLSVLIYQLVCFSVWGIPRARRRDYIVIDRYKLAYLNGIEKLNCLYCEYANGVIALTREVAARTEQYWCPIRHATRPLGAHERARDFLDYGDAEGWRTRLAEIRAKIV
jgi:hypothetical protein